ncbi:hypothetical protein MM236_19185 [Belliella sp. DSM 107340]|uniref:Phage tail protein n=1 Tax=Belliella calami TaxID=2923436 RepID=A0ABS9UU21_9BACT|nr:hypothetical protein [Belliella calami]MCH7400128.1 hypothetical protein [Belliella calami]
MHYYYNNISLSTFGIIPGQSSLSNIAISGHLDFPKRINKTEQLWEDRNGIEPYVSTGEIQFGGRDIDFHFLLNAATQSEANYKLLNLYKMIDEINQLKAFTCDFGSWNVYVRDEIKINVLGNGWCSGIIPFREPVCDLNGDLPINGDINNIQGIDGFNFNNLGFFLTDFRRLGIYTEAISGLYNRPKPKQQQAYSYEKESYQITKHNSREYILKGVIQSNDYSRLVNVIKGLNALFSQVGTRILYLPEDMIRLVFCKNGFKVSEINIDSTVTATIEINLTEAEEAAEDENYLLLGDTLNRYVTTTVGQKIIVKI